MARGVGVPVVGAAISAASTYDEATGGVRSSGSAELAALGRMPRTSSRTQPTRSNFERSGGQRRSTRLSRLGSLGLVLASAALAACGNSKEIDVGAPGGASVDVPAIGGSLGSGANLGGGAGMSAAGASGATPVDDPSGGTGGAPDPGGCGIVGYVCPAAPIGGDSSVAGATGGTPECFSDAACDDADPCNGVERCVAGDCQPGRSPCGAFDAAHCACAPAASGGCAVRGLDADGDGYPTSACAAAPGDDCDDASGAIHPNAVEQCNGIDDDCDGAFDLDAGVPMTLSVPRLVATESFAGEISAAALGESDVFGILYDPYGSGPARPSGISLYLVDSSGALIARSTPSVAESMSSAIAASADQFAVVWTEGNDGVQQVKLQVLSSDGSPFGLPVLVGNDATGDAAAIAWEGSSWVVAYAARSDANELNGQLRVKRVNHGAVDEAVTASSNWGKAPHLAATNTNQLALGWMRDGAMAFDGTFDSGWLSIGAGLAGIADTTRMQRLANDSYPQVYVAAGGDRFGVVVDADQRVLQYDTTGQELCSASWSGAFSQVYGIAPVYDGFLITATRDCDAALNCRPVLLRARRDCSLAEQQELTASSHANTSPVVASSSSGVVAAWTEDRGIWIRTATALLCGD